MTMTGLWKFGAKNGKERGLLALYILHSLDLEPKSGYALLKEIAEKTEGQWVPSKGAVYPLLRQLEEDDLITLCGTGTRAKKIFEPTEKGWETLRHIRMHKSASREKLVPLKNLLFEIFGEEKQTSKSLIFDIRFLVDDLSADREDRVVDILERCRDELQRIE
jgi:DNA-binding PadR family transcriptional regulator